MTESEWNSCQDPQTMLDFLRTTGRASERKLRLFACTCARRVWHLLEDERSRRAVAVAESYAAGETTLDEVKAAGELAIEATWTVKDADWPTEQTRGNF
jgi:Imm-5 like putative immunity protein